MLENGAKADLSDGRLPWIKETVAIMFSVVLALIWFGGVLGFQLPNSVDPKVNPLSNVAAQFLLYLPVLLVGMQPLCRGALALVSIGSNLDSLIFASSAIATVEGFFAVVLTAITARHGRIAEAGNCAAFNFFWIASAQLATVMLFKREKREKLVYTYGIVSNKTLSERICVVFVLTAVLFATIIFGVQFFCGAGALLSLCYALAVVTVCCPIAILTTPLNIYAEVKKAMRKCGCTVENPLAYEAIGASDFVAFEDNSLLIEDRPSLYDLYSVDADKKTLLTHAATAASHATGQYAAAIVRAACELELPRYDATDCFTSKYGFCATVCGEDRRIGDLNFMQKEGVFLPKWVAGIELGGMQPLYAAVGGNLCGILLFYYRTKPDVVAALQRLERIGAIPLLPYDGGMEIRALAEKLFKGEEAHSPKWREKVLQASKEDDKIRLTAGGELIATLSEPSLSALVGVVSLCKCTVRALQFFMFGAFAVIGACLPLAVALFPWFNLAVISAVCAATFFAPLLFTVLISRKLRCFTPLEFLPEEEETAMFGKVNYTIHVEGMSCSHCAAHVKSALEAIRGVSAKVELEEKIARVKCPTSLDENLLVEAITEAGFTVASVERV